MGKLISTHFSAMEQTPTGVTAGGISDDVRNASNVP